MDEAPVSNFFMQPSQLVFNACAIDLHCRSLGDERHHPAVHSVNLRTAPSSLVAVLGQLLPTSDGPPLPISTEHGQLL
jgi:hypothetical protein